MVVKVTVSGKPEPKGSTRAFSVKSKYPGAKYPYRAVVTSDNPRLKAWATTVAAQAGIAMRAAGLFAPVAGPVHVRLRFVLLRALSNRRPEPTIRPDLDKLVRGALDAITGTMLRDDSQVTSLCARKKYTVCAEDVRTELAVRIRQ